MKGHVKIELTDVVSGKKDVYEQDNMMTNALAKMLAFTSGHSMGQSTLNVYASHWYYLLGGVALFDTAFDTDPNHFYPPAGTNMVGCGGVEDANSYTWVTPWGIYNAQESDLSQTDAKKMVWDFPTNHANGTIASVALTHRNTGRFWGFGTSAFHNTQTTEKNRIIIGESIRNTSKGLGGAYENGYGTIGSSLLTADGTYLDFCIDAENDYKYQAKVCLDGISIIKHKMSPEKLDVFRSSTTYQSFVEETYAETFTGTYFYVFYNTDEKCLYFWCLNSNNYSVSSMDIYIHKFDMTSKILTKNWGHIVQNAISSTNFYPTGLIITNNSAYYLSVSSSVYKLCKYTFSSGTIDNITLSANTDAGFRGRRAYVLQGKIYIQGAVYNSANSNYAWYTLIYDTSADTVYYTNSNTTRQYSSTYSNTYDQTIPPIDNEQCVFGSMLPVYSSGNSRLGLYSSFGLDYEGGSNYLNNSYANMWTPGHYLATKCNLAEPAVKTAQRTMKLTYTITKEEE